MTEHLCVLCRRRELPQWRPQVCEPCEDRMRAQLSMLTKGVPFLAVIAANEPLPNGHPNLDAIDLTLPGNPITTGHPTDQTGHTPVATKLAQYAEDWSRRDILFADATAVATFLQRGLKWACASYPAINPFAEELRTAYASVRHALNRNLTGRHYETACGQCAEKRLIRRPGADWIECTNCHALYDTNEYVRLAIEDAEATARATFAAHRPLTAREAALLAGVSYDTIRQWSARGKIWPDIGPWGGRRYLRIVIDRCQADLEHRTRNHQTKHATATPDLRLHKVSTSVTL